VRYGYIISEEERKDAQTLIPKVRSFPLCTVPSLTRIQVGSLAHYLHDSTSQGACFDLKVKETVKNNTAKSAKTKLDRKNDTRWNSDFRCLAAHNELAPAVKLYLDDPETPQGVNKRFSLSPRLEDVLAGVLPCLSVCNFRSSPFQSLRKLIS
jgi:hypothetical protein